MGYRISTLIYLLLLSFSWAQERILTYPDVEKLVLKNNLELKGLRKSIEASESRVLQSMLRLNPELEFFSVEGGEPEKSAQISQTIELGQKRLKRARIAELELNKAKLSYQRLEIDILKEVKKAFTDILLAQHIVDLKQEKVDVAEKFLQSINKRVRAGRLSPVESARAKIELTNHQLALSQAHRELASRWRQLAAYWGRSTSDYSIAQGNFTSLTNVPSEESLQSKIEESPRFQLKLIERQIQNAILDAEQTRRIPDITLSAGVSKTPDTGNSLVGGISIPLKVFNRNQGAIQAAYLEADRIEQEINVSKITLQTELSAIYSNMLIDLEEIEALENTILPEAENAFRIINTGYLQGKFDFLDVMNAQNTLYTAQEKYWTVLANFQKAVAEIEALIGQPLQP